MHKPLTVGSLFSGIGGFDLGFEQAGFQTVWQVEKEPFCIAVLKTKFPNAERYHDVLRCGKDRVHKLRAVDVVTAGFPCQDLSVAGKRAGLEGARSGLFWEVVRILGELRPAWFVLENVPGLFSSGEGRDFAIVLNALDELGYGVAWRVLNSQFFGVAQRRRRVFIVGRFGKPCPPEVLFEPQDGPRDFEPSREAGPELAYALAASVRGSGDGHGNGWNSNYVVAACLQGSGHSGEPEPGEGIIPCVVADSITASYAKSPDSADSSRGPRNIIFATLNSGGNSGGFRTEPGEHLVVHSAPAANRGRDFTRLPSGMDSPRYRALGNAVTVSVAKWIAERIRVISTGAP